MNAKPIASQLETVREKIFNAILSHYLHTVVASLSEGVLEWQQIDECVDAKSPLREKVEYPTFSTCVELLSAIGAEACLFPIEFFMLFYKTIFQSIASRSLNTLFTVKDYCNWKRGMQIQFNFSTLIDAVSNELSSQVEFSQSKSFTFECKQSGNHLFQAAKLLQLSSASCDVDSLKAVCFSLSGAQIFRLLKNSSASHSMLHSFAQKFVKSDDPLIFEC